MSSILILGPHNRNKDIIEYFCSLNINVYCINSMPNQEEISRSTHLISNGFAKKIPKTVLDHFKRFNRINIHSTYLPFGKGIGGALTGLVYPVPLGVTIHILEEEFDSGEIIFQKQLKIIDMSITQRELYQTLLDSANNLFLENAWNWLNYNFIPSAQPEFYYSPYSHRTNSEILLSILSNGWDSSLDEINELALVVAMRKAWEEYFRY